LQNPFSMNV